MHKSKAILASMGERRLKKYAYPNIARWMTETLMSTAELARRTCYSEGSVTLYLTGKQNPPFNFVLDILRMSGMPFEVAFEKKEEE